MTHITIERSDLNALISEYDMEDSSFAKRLQALAAPVQEPFGYLYEGIAHTKGKTLFYKTQVVRFETRWWREIGPCYITPPAAQPAPVQEPVAVVSGYYGGQCVILPIDPARIFNSNTALYTKDQL